MKYTTFKKKIRETILPHDATQRMLNDKNRNNLT